MVKPIAKPIRRLLIANRGEIALRIIRAARELGIETVAVYSKPDEATLPVRAADHRISLNGVKARETYLDSEKIILAAIQSGADALHPGYGFFAENGEFAKKVTDEGIRFVGPSPEVISLMGDKDQARRIAVKAGVPVVPGSEGAVDEKTAKIFAERVGYPVLIKALAGGSGRGMRLAETASDLGEKLEEARREAEAAFGNGAVLLERYLPRARHIEVQVFGDSHGNVIHLGERECSIQRRHQKLVEETPAAKLHPKLREKLCEAAVKLAKEVSYSSAGTVEFMVEGGESEDSPFYFLEMNTRIQVEHPVTEQVWGLDLVQLQILVAQGGALPYSQQELIPRGHAMEFRINAENPTRDFSPVSGKVLYVSRNGGIGVREDGWIESGTEISAHYDSLLSKLIISGANRTECLARARATLSQYILEGIPSTLDFHRYLLTCPDFNDGRVDAKWVERNYHGEVLPAQTVGPLKLPPPRV